jgi:ADP-ribosylglycohydrolase
VIGSAYEGAKKYPEVVSAEAGFPLFSEKSKFTDDSVLTIALADALMTPEQNMEEKFREYTLKYPGRWYGKGFLKWVDQDFSDDFVGKSFANGSAMRVAPIGWAGSDLSEVLSLSEKSAKTSHDHPDGIKGAQAIATATYLAKMGATKEEIRAYVQDTFSYPLAQDADQLEKTHDL